MNRGKFLIMVWCFLVFSSNLFSQIPRTLLYQGILTDTKGNLKPDSSYVVTCGIYNQESGGTPLWTQTDTVTTSQGCFSTILGSKTPLNLPFDRQYWIGVSVGGTELVPRMKLSSSAYSMRADTANVEPFFLSRA